MQVKIVTARELDIVTDEGFLSLIDTEVTFGGHRVYLSTIDGGKRDKESLSEYVKQHKWLASCDMDLLKKAAREIS